MDSTVGIWDLTSKHRMKWGFNPKQRGIKPKIIIKKNMGLHQPKNGFGLVVGIYVTKNTYETCLKKAYLLG